MKHLLDLLAAVALLVWGTHLVRTGVLRVFGSNLRQILATSTGNRFAAALSGLGVTALVQSSTATALITGSFVGRGLIALPAALAVMLGADIGTSLMAVLFHFDLSWLSPLFIFIGVTLFISRQGTQVGDFGRVLIGLGLMLLALRLVSASTSVLTQNPAVQLMLESLGSDRLLEILLGATLAVLSYSSLAVVLLSATLATQVVGLDVALGLVLGANLGSGVLAVITTAKSGISTRQVPLGNLLFKVFGVAIAPWLIPFWLRLVQPLVQDPATLTVLFHLSFNVMVGLVFIGLTKPISRMVDRLLPLQAGNSPLDWPHPRWPFPARRARPCTRPTSWKPCCAAWSPSSRPTT
jgi:phosphate:Na+ symporter